MTLLFLDPVWLPGSSVAWEKGSCALMLQISCQPSHHPPPPPPTTPTPHPNAPGTYCSFPLCFSLEIQEVVSGYPLALECHGMPLTTFSSVSSVPGDLASSVTCAWLRLAWIGQRSLKVSFCRAHCWVLDEVQRIPRSHSLSGGEFLSWRGGPGIHWPPLTSTVNLNNAASSLATERQKRENGWLRGSDEPQMFTGWH